MAAPRQRPPALRVDPRCRRRVTRVFAGNTLYDYHDDSAFDGCNPLMTRLTHIAACIAVATAGMAVAQAPSQEIGSTNREANLLAQNNPAAATVAALPKGTSVRVLERAGGGWMRVDAQGKIGWIRTLAYSPPTSVATGSGPGVFAAISGAQAAPKVGIGAIGARGLTEEDMKNATPNEAQLNKLNSFAQSAAQGDQMARNNRLQSAQIAFLNERGQPIAGGSK